MFKFLFTFFSLLSLLNSDSATNSESMEKNRIIDLGDHIQMIKKHSYKWEAGGGWGRTDVNYGMCGEYLNKDVTYNPENHSVIPEASNDDHRAKSVLRTINFDTGTYSCEFSNVFVADVYQRKFTKTYQVKNYKKNLIRHNYTFIRRLHLPANDNKFYDEIGIIGTSTINTNTITINAPKIFESLFHKKAPQDELYKLSDKFDIDEFSDSLTPFKFGQANENRVTMSEVIIGSMLLSDKYLLGVGSNGKLYFKDDIIYNLDNQLTPFVTPYYLAATTSFDGESKVKSTMNSTFESLFDRLTEKPGDELMEYMGFFVHEGHKRLLSTKFEQGALVFYVKIFGVLMEAFEYIAYTLLLFIVLYYFLTMLSKLAINKLFPDKESQGSSPISSTKIAALATVFVIGFLTFDSEVKYDDILDHNDQKQIKTTIAKDFISFVALEGDHLATNISDYLFAEYSAYLLRKSLTEIEQSFKQKDMGLKLNLMKLKMEMSFYNNMCKKIYKGALKNPEGLPEHMAGRYTSVIQNDTAVFNILFRSKDGIKAKINYVSPTLCYDISNSIEQRAERVKKGAALFSKFLEGGSTDKVIRKLANFQYSRIFAQYQFGWFNVVTIPFMHSFGKILFQTMGALSAGDSAADLTPIRTIIRVNVLKESEENREEQEALRRESIDLVKKLPFFIMPGFSAVYNKVKEIVDSKIDSRMSKDNLASLKKLFDGIFLMYGEDTNSEAGIVSVAAKLYEIEVKMLFTAIISIFVVIKIVFWLFDILKYFFVSPFAVFWGFVQEKGQNQLGAFITRGFVLLMVKPILIVITVVLFIVGYDLFYFIYELSIGNILGSAKVAKEAAHVLSYGSGDGILIMSLIDSLDALFNIILLLVLTFVGYKMIMDGDIWILSVLGYSDQAVTKNDMSSIASDLRMKLQNI